MPPRATPPWWPTVKAGAASGPPMLGTWVRVDDWVDLHVCGDPRSAVHGPSCTPTSSPPAEPDSHLPWEAVSGGRTDPSCLLSFIVIQCVSHDLEAQWCQGSACLHAWARGGWASDRSQRCCCRGKRCRRIDGGTFGGLRMSVRLSAHILPARGYRWGL
jgi:hypothetical protein